MSPRSFFGILLALVVSTAGTPAAALATTIPVTTTVDELNSDGDCSLREAIKAANTNVAVDACPAGQDDQTDTITLPAGTYTLTVPGDDNDASGGDLDLLNNAAALDLVINGAGAATTIIQACAVDQRSAACPAGQGLADRVLHVIAHVEISGVTIRHGRAPYTGLRRGNGIWVDGFNNGGTDKIADLTLTDVVVTKNGVLNPDVDVEGGGIANEYNGKLTLVRTTVSDNAASGTGTFRGGGGIFNGGNANSTLVMIDSTVSGNTADGETTGGGIWNSISGRATLTGCTISGNHDGGIANAGQFSQSVMTITNCTISGNESQYGGGGITNQGTLDLRSSTVTLNRRLVGSNGNGGGGIVTSGTTVLRNTIVAGNIDDENQNIRSPDCDDNGGALVTSEGFSFVGDGTHCTGLVDGANGDQIGSHAAPIDAMLGPLAANGGPTLTHAFLDGSLAIDAGDPATPGSGGIACPSTDQRGEARPDGAACDIGAFEGGDSGKIGATAVQPARGGTAGTVQVKVLGSGFVSGAVVRLVRAGFPDVVGTATDVRATVVTASLDLHGVAPGTWSVEVENPAASVATLTDAFTVEAGGGSDVWAKLLDPPAFNTGRVQSIYILFGNRGTVDAYGVPLWLALSESLQWSVPFTVSPPPAQPGQIATDWSKVGIDVRRVPSAEIPEQADAFHFLLPIVPAGYSGVLRMRVKSPIFHEPTDPGVPANMYVATNIGTPYYQPGPSQPDLSADVVASYVAQAKQYAVNAHGTTTFPADATIAAYVRTQLAAVVADGRLAALANETGNLPIYSQSQLIIDTGQFIAGEGSTAAATSADRDWLARIVAELVGSPVDARTTDPCASYTNPTDKIFCEEETDPCKDGCSDDAPLVPPTVPCEGSIKVVLDLLGAPCKPDPDPVPFHVPLDPNYKAGPSGFIDGVTPLSYTVTFENVKTATGDAFEVTVTDQLDVAKYDLATFSLGPIAFADKFVPVPSGLEHFSTEVDMRPGVNILVGIDAALDSATGIITWKFTTLDPATHEFPEDPVDGFLPPNVTSPEGEAEMIYTVSLKPGFGVGTMVCNDASIVFDFNPPIVTNDFCNTIGAPEDCENCVDDDGDGLVDRADPDCTAPANGAGAGVGDAATGKAVDKCAKAIRKAGAKLMSDRLKRLGACEKAVADCVQLKPGDAACLTKARTTCGKARAGFPTAAAKETAAIVKACGEPTLAGANLLAAVGVGFSGESAPCGTRGLAGVSTAADVAECVSRQHGCAAARAFEAAVPRARELLVLGGFDPATDLGCFAASANGGGAAVAAEKRKAIRKCDVAIQKAATKLVAGRTKAGETCDAAVFTCLQTKPGDAACVTKAGGTCTKAIAGLSKLDATFTAAIAKACGVAPLVPADVLGTTGLGAGALAARCKALGVASLATVADVSACLAKELSCQSNQLLENTTPRLDELLDLGGVTLP